MITILVSPKCFDHPIVTILGHDKMILCHASIFNTPTPRQAVF